MAKVKDNLLTNGFSGTIGKQLTYRQIGGQTFVSKYQAAPAVAPTEKKIAARLRFAIATAYAKRVIKDPELKSLYQAVVKGGQRAFNIAIMDALQAPVVETILIENYRGMIGDTIIIHAKDDFKVAGVILSVYDPSGVLLESGNAVLQEDGIEWLYTTQKENPAPSGSKITAVASDLPGNSTSFRLNI